MLVSVILQDRFVTTKPCKVWPSYFQFLLFRSILLKLKRVVFLTSRVSYVVSICVCKVYMVSTLKFLLPDLCNVFIKDKVSAIEHANQEAHVAKYKEMKEKEAAEKEAKEKEAAATAAAASTESKPQENGEKSEATSEADKSEAVPTEPKVDTQETSETVAEAEPQAEESAQTEEDKDATGDTTIEGKRVYIFKLKILLTFIQ